MISWILIVSSIFLVAGLMCVAIGLFTQDVTGGNLIGLGVVLFLFTILFGFGLFATVVECGEPTIEYIKPEIARSDSTIFAKIDDKTIETKEHKYFLVKEQDIKIKKITHVNSYGVSLSDMIEYSFYIEGEKELEKQEKQ
jgi:hypothetical protein